MSTRSIKGMAFLASLLAGLPAAATMASSASTMLPGETTYFPMQTISRDLGSKAALGYFVREAGACQVVMVIGEKPDPEAASTSSAARLRLALLPGQRAGVDSEEGGSIDLTCGNAADTLSVRSASIAELPVVTD